MAYNSKLRDAIREKFGSQRDFAAKIGMHESRVSLVVNGRWVLTESEMKRWARALGVPMEQVFDGEQTSMKK